MVERKTLNLVAVGSIPTGGVYNFFSFIFFVEYFYLTRDTVAEWLRR